MTQQTFNISDYWDFCSPGDDYKVVWYDAPGSIAFGNHNYWTKELGGCTRQDSYRSGTFAADTWQDSWYYYRDPVRGVLEIADNAPKESFLDKALLFFTPYRSMVYAAGKEIPWGAEETIGTTKTWDVLMDHNRSAYLPPFPGYWSHAKQICEYVEHLDTWTDSLGRTHSDVIRIINKQPWRKRNASDVSCHACNYYLVRGIGRVGVEWTTYDATGTLINTNPLQSAVYSGSIMLPA